MTLRRTLATLALCGAAALAAAPAAQAEYTAKDAPPVYKPTLPPGTKTLKYKYRLNVEPGQNIIAVDVQKERPKEDGWIVGFRPGLVRVGDGKSPKVDEIHLHHAVWLVNLRPTFASGEEKTYFNAPPGFGWRYTTKQIWLLNHMIHNLTPTPERVDITMEFDLLPDSAPAARSIKELRTQWMDVQGIKPYPVFDALKGQGGRDGKLVYPDDVPNAYAADGGRERNKWVVDRDATLAVTAGHLHPGGLHTDLWLERGGRRVNLFRSRAIYYEKAGPVSWDVSMTATKPDWRIAVKKGDVLSTNATYDTRRASWYEGMGIMVVGITNGPEGGVDPFSEPVPKDDVLTHGRLPENVDRGGRPNPGLANPLKLADGPRRKRVVIDDFQYRQGDLALRGRRGLPPVVAPGQSLEFVNRDTPTTVRFHTITGCKEPCNRTGGIRYPLADDERPLDSGNLGFGPEINLGSIYRGERDPQPFTAAANRRTWKTPKNLKPGTYAYFCRVHPFMRGAFRVKGTKSRR